MASAQRLNRALILFYILILSILVNLISSQLASAGQLINRSVQLSSAAPSAVSSYTVEFTYFNTSNIGSLKFEFCDNSPIISDPCNAPTGLSLSTANLSAQNGNVGFSIDNSGTTPNQIILTRPSIPAVALDSSYTLSNVINPSVSNYAVYVRITTLASTDATGNYTDYGSAAFSTSTQFSVGAFIPPYLTFCIAITVAIDCSSGSGTSLDLGIFRTSAPSDGTSQFSVATNDVSGYNITILGTTMTSGNNVIPSLNTPSSSSISHSQFGINLRNNSFPNVGSDPDGPGGAGSPTPDYNQPNLFVYRDGDSIASSSTSSYFRRMTTSYLVNIDPSQAPGVYDSTFTYVATVQF